MAHPRAPLLRTLLPDNGWAGLRPGLELGMSICLPVCHIRRTRPGSTRGNIRPSSQPFT